MDLDRFLKGGFLRNILLSVTTTAGGFDWEFDLTTPEGRAYYRRALRPFNAIQVHELDPHITVRHIHVCAEGTHWTDQPGGLKPLCCNGFRG